LLVSPADTHALRFVTHRHITSADIDAAAAIFARLWKPRQTLRR
jgi:hypothetical protein